MRERTGSCDAAMDRVLSPTAVVELAHQKGAPGLGQGHMENGRCTHMLMLMRQAEIARSYNAIRRSGFNTQADAEARIFTKVPNKL